MYKIMEVIDLLVVKKCQNICDFVKCESTFKSIYGINKPLNHKLIIYKIAENQVVGYYML